MCVSQGRLWALARSRSPAHSNTLWPPEDPPPTASEAEDPACRGHLRFRGGGSPAAIQHPGMSTDPQRAPPPIFRACRVPCQTACILYASWVSPPSPGHGQGSWSQEEGDGSSLGSLHVASDPEFHRKASNPSSSSDPCTAHHGMVGKPLVLSGFLRTGGHWPTLVVSGLRPSPARGPAWYEGPQNRTLALRACHSPSRSELIHNSGYWLGKKCSSQLKAPCRP